MTIGLWSYSLLDWTGVIIWPYRPCFGLEWFKALWPLSSDYWRRLSFYTSAFPISYLLVEQICGTWALACVSGIIPMSNCGQLMFGFHAWQSFCLFLIQPWRKFCPPPPLVGCDVCFNLFLISRRWSQPLPTLTSFTFPSFMSSNSFFPQAIPDSVLQ